MIADHPIEMFHHEDDEQDWLPAIMRAQLQVPSRLEHPFQPTHEPDPQHPIWPGHAGWEDRQGDHGAGFTLRFAARTYRFSGPIPIIRGMRLTGAGGGALGTTRFKFDAPLPARRDGMTVNPPPELGHKRFSPALSCTARTRQGSRAMKVTDTAPSSKTFGWRATMATG